LPFPAAGAAPAAPARAVCCDVDDTLAAHTLLLTFADMRARVIYIHTDIPVISERRFFCAFSGVCSGSPPDADSLPDALPDADGSSSLWVPRSVDGELLDVCRLVDV
jgi:hypothetical protein